MVRMVRSGARAILPPLIGLVALLVVLAVPSSAEVVTLWHSFRGKEAEALETAVAAFNEAHAHQVRLVAVDGADYLTRVETALARPNPSSPDIVVWAHDKIVPWARRGWLLPLDGLVPAEVLDEYIPRTIEPLRVDGRLYGLPLAFEALMLYYNRDLVATPPRTTNELLAAARRVSNPRRDRWGLVYERDNFYAHAIWLHAFGGSVFDTDGRFAVQSPAMVKSLAYARDLARVHRIIPDTVDWKRQIDLFNEGRAAFLISGPWAYGSLDWGRVPIGIAPLPVHSATGRPAAPFLGVKAFAVNARSPRIPLAVEVVRHLTSAFSGCLMNVVAGYMPANRGAYEYDALTSHPMTARPQVFWDSSVLLPVDPRMAHVWTVMMHDDATGHPGVLRRVFSGTRPEVALREARRRFEALEAAAGVEDRGRESGPVAASGSASR